MSRQQKVATKGTPNAPTPPIFPQAATRAQRGRGQSVTPTPGSSRHTPASQMAPSPGDVFMGNEEIDIHNISSDLSEDEDSSAGNNLPATPVLVSPTKQRKMALSLAKQPDEDIWHINDQDIIGKLTS
jgi:hypothetical protein